MKQISREGIQRMITVPQASGGGGGGSFDPTAMGLASEAWVEENYISKAFFNRLFTIHSASSVIDPNDPDEEQTIDSIEALVGLWTEQYLSALGQGSGGGGGGGGSDTLADLIDVELTNPVAGQVLKYNGTKWINAAASAGTVTSVAMSVPTGFTLTGSPITVSGVLGLSFADGYSLPTTAKQTNWDAAYTWTSTSRTTLADYGITDAKFGTPGTDSIPITLGSTTQSVLTQHQSLANYYTKSETDGKFLTISFFRSLFRAYTSSNTEVQPNDGSTSTIDSIKAMFGFWTEQYLSALGQSSGGGGGVTLNQPLQGINQAGLSAPTRAGQILVYNGTTWAYAGDISISNLTAYVGTFNSNVTAVGSFTSQGGNFIAQNGGFKVTGKDDTYVLLAGGGTKLLSEIVGGTPKELAQSALSATTGDLSTFYTGDSLTYAAAPGTNSIADKPSGVGAFGILSFKTASGYHGQMLLDINGNLYFRSKDVLSGGWKQASTSDTTNTTGATSGSGYQMYIVGARSQDAHPITYTNSLAYIDADGYLYSGGTKVITSITSSMVTNALGFTPAASSDLSNYVTLSTTQTISGGKRFSSIIDFDSWLVIWDGSSHNKDMSFGWRSDYFNMYALENSVYYDICIGQTTASGGSLYYDASAGSWGIGTGAPAYTLDVVGDVRATNFRGALIGNADTATTASKLSTTSQTLFGNTYWTSDGVPTSVGTSSTLANLDYVGSLTMYGVLVLWESRNKAHDFNIFWRGDVVDIYALENTVYDLCIGRPSTSTSDGALYYDASEKKWGIGTNTPSYALSVNGDVSATNFRGNLVGNADTATKLATKRKIYGNDFDGTANIVNSLTMEGWLVIWEGSSRTHDMDMGWRGDFFNIYAYENSIFYDICIGRTSASNGALYYDASAESWGINTATPAYTLDVVGTAQFGGNGMRKVRLGSTSNAASISMAYPSGSSYVSLACMNLTSANNLAIGQGVASNGNTVTVYFANGVYMEYDSTNGAVKLNGSFYATGSVSALGSSSSGTTYLDQATADARYLKLSGGQTMTGSFTGTSITLNSQMKSTNAVATDYLTVGTSSLSTSYTLYVNGTAKIKNLTITDIIGTNNETRLETSNALLRLKASASVYANNTLISSDMRMKHIHSYASAGIEQIANAPVFNFVFTDAPQYVHLGTSAQYWQTIFPCAVDTMPDTYLAMDYGSIALASAVMVARKVQSHEERIAALEAENARLQKELNDIKAA